MAKPPAKKIGSKKLQQIKAEILEAGPAVRKAIQKQLERGIPTGQTMGEKLDEDAAAKPLVLSQVETTKAEIEKSLAGWRMEFCRLSLALSSQTLMFAKNPATGQSLEGMFHDPHVNDIVDDSISQIFNQLVNCKREIEKSREVLDLLNKNTPA